MRKSFVTIGFAGALGAMAMLGPASVLAAPGNNGDIHVVTTSNPDGTPGCSFDVVFHNFDSGPVVSDLEFALQSPTRGTATGPVATRQAVLAGGHQSSESHTFDLSAELLASGATPTDRGYHVKVTTHTPFSNGADTKHKVFWVGACGIDPTGPGDGDGDGGDGDGDGGDGDGDGEIIVT